MKDKIKVTNGVFTCVEYENEVKPLTNSVEGIVEADLTAIKNDLKEFPTKVVYGICPVCGMEYVFELDGEELSLVASEEEK